VSVRVWEPLSAGLSLLSDAAASLFFLSTIYLSLLAVEAGLHARVSQVVADPHAWETLPAAALVGKRDVGGWMLWEGLDVAGPAQLCGRRPNSDLGASRAAAAVACSGRAPPTAVVLARSPHAGSHLGGGAWEASSRAAVAEVRRQPSGGPDKQIQQWRRSSVRGGSPPQRWRTSWQWPHYKKSGLVWQMQTVMLSTIFVIKSALWQKSSVMLVVIERPSHNVPCDDFMCNRNKMSVPFVTEAICRHILSHFMMTVTVTYWAVNASHNT
jgi:hypothetical protein